MVQIVARYPIEVSLEGNIDLMEVADMDDNFHYPVKQS